MLNEQDITFLLLGVILAIIGSIFLLSVRNKKKKPVDYYKQMLGEPLVDDGPQEIDYLMDKEMSNE